MYHTFIVCSTVLSSEEKRHYITYVLNRNGPIFSVIWRSNAWKNYIFRIAKYSAIIELNMPGHFLVILLVFWQKCLGNQVKNGQISLTILVSNSCHAVQPTMHFSYAARNCFTLMCLLLHTFHFRLHRGIRFYRFMAWLGDGWYHEAPVVPDVDLLAVLLLQSAFFALFGDR